MLRWIIGSSANFRMLVIAVAAGLLAAGIVQLRNATLEVLPDFGPVRVEVQTEALGLSPEEVENLITNPMENEFFNGIPWLAKLRSDSAPGVSSIEMIFEPGTDPVRARQVVQERLTMVPALPQVSKPPFVIQPTATTGRLMLIGLSSRELSLIDLSVLARWKVRQRLLSVPGVSNVSIWGFRDRQLQVLIDPHRLNRRGVTVDEVIRTAANAMWSSPLTYVEASTPGTGGFIDTANQRISVNHTQPIKTAKELAQVMIQGGDSPRKKSLGQVAEIVETHQPLIGDAIVGGAPGVMLVVERFPGASIPRTTREVERALDAMRPGLSGVQIDTSVYRAASFVETARANLVQTLVIGFVLLVLAIGAFLSNWRTALISIATITLSLGVAWLVLWASGAPLNLLIIAGLVMALAVIVDDSIVDVDAIRRRLAQRSAERGGASAIDTIAAASLAIRGPLLWALAIVVASVVPMLVVGEASGAFLRPLAFTYALAVLVSTVVALTVTPALAVALLARDSLQHAESPLAQWLGRGYAVVLGACVRRPAWPLGAAAVVILGGLAVLPRLDDASLAPALKDRDLLVRLKGAPGTSLPAMARITGAMSKELADLPGIRSVGAHIGRASTSDLVTDVNSAEVWLSIDHVADYDGTVAAIGAVVHGYPGLRAEISAYPNLRIRELTAGPADELLVRVYGLRYDVLADKAELVAKSVAQVAGVARPQVRLPAMEPMVEIEVVLSKAAARGVKPGDIRRAAATMLAGITAGNLFDEQKIFDVVVWADPDRRENLASIHNMLVETPDNDKQVRLGDVADVRVRPNPSVIKRDAVSRYIDVSAKVQGRSLDAVTRDVEARLAKITFPIEYHVEVLGDAAERQGAQHRLLGYAIAAAIAVFFLLQACFSSWRLAWVFLGLLALPLAGAALAAALLGDAVSVLSLMGGLAVIAVAVRGGILQVRHLQRLEEAGAAFGPDLVLRGARERFGAIALSTVATALALVPLLAYGVVAGLEIVTPLAAVVLGGLLGAAALNLFVLPALYLRFAPRPDATHAGETPQLAPR